MGAGQPRQNTVRPRPNRASAPDKPSLERVNSVNPPQAGPTLPVGPNKGGTGKSIPHTFTEVLDSVREDPSAASFPSIF